MNARTIPLPSPSTNAPRGHLASVTASPVVKWAGGKGRLLEQLTALLPDDVACRRYFEPFAGGAALFFALRPREAFLRDINPQLMAMYVALRDEPEALIASLQAFARAHSAEQFYEVRAQYNRAVESPGRRLRATWRAAAFVYLNKTCFNGLHRVNRRGEFNVPAGRYLNPSIVDPLRMRVASRALQGIDLGCAGFEAVLEYARAGDFFYLDPPYLPVARGSFTAYAGEFGLMQHRRLADVFRALDRRGCYLMLSNSACPAVRELYRGYRVESVLARRAINSDARGRGAVQEFVIRNYGPRGRSKVSAKP